MLGYYVSSAEGTAGGGSSRSCPNEPIDISKLLI